MADAANPPSGRSAMKGGRCPICRAPTEQAFRPFCSRRCADVDLSRWLGGAYAIAGGGADADEDGDEVGSAGRSPPESGRDQR